MDFFDYLQIIVSLLVLILLAPPLGKYIYNVYENKDSRFRNPFRFLETLIEKLLGESYHEDMGWRQYAGALLIFNFLGFVFVYLLQMTQGYLPLNPDQLPNVSWDSALNTAVSFMTNTNWQGYSGEVTMSYLTQMLALATQNFFSAATGMAVAIALARGLAKRNSKTIGNFWSDTVRGTVYILLPLSVILALILAGQGVVQTFSGKTTVTTLEGVEQVIPMGPAASQVAIKQLGTNGGGFFGVNSAHPYENPTPFSNWLELIAILLIPAAMVYSYGLIINNRKQAWVLFSVMMSLLVIGLSFSLWSEYSSNLALMEGKETRIGVTNSILWSVFTTAASNGSVNAMHSSLSPLSGAVSMFNMMLGEIIFGGVGSGLYGMLLFVLLTVFISGLMVGRTPEYLGKKIESFEIKMVIIAILIPNAVVLIGSGISVILPAGLSSLANQGPHGLSEIIYAFASAGNNNGSAFAGLNANTPYYNVMLSAAMMLGRFGVILPILAIAGSLANKTYSPPSKGTFDTESLLFGVLLMGIILVVGGLTFFPSLALGPIVEHLLMNSGVAF